MKKVTIILTGVILMALNAINVNAQNQASTNAAASATILEHISIIKDVDLAFGGIITDADGGTVVVPASSGSTATYNNLPLQVAGQTISAAKFTVNGADAATFAITLPGTVTISSSTSNMDVDNFVSSVGTSNVQLEGGEAEFYVGATLNIQGDQDAGVYTGSFSVTVTYE